MPGLDVTKEADFKVSAPVNFSLEEKIQVVLLPVYHVSKPSNVHSIMYQIYLEILLKFQPLDHLQQMLFSFDISHYVPGNEFH